MEQFFFIIELSFISSIIVIPFQTYNPLLNKNQSLQELIVNSSDKDIIDTLSRNLIYIKLNIGEKTQSIPTFLEMYTNGIVLKDISMNTNTPNFNFIKNANFTYKDNYLLKKILDFNYYNSSLSKTYKFIEKSYELYADLLMKEIYYANETIYFNQRYNKDDKEITKPIIFYIKFKELDNIDHRPAIIGFHIQDDRFIYNFKKNSIINDYSWSIKYSNSLDDTGELIIGGLPHIYDKDNYDEKNLRYTKVAKENFIKYSFNFNIYIKFENKTEYFLGLNEIGTFYIEEFFMTGTHEYFNYIEDNFFQKYIIEGYCRRQIHKKASYDNDYFHFICNIENGKKREEFFKNFPNLVFYQKDMNYNFEFNAKDLFIIIPDNKRILFNIDFCYYSKKWILGKPFFKKYQMIFNPDSKLISYYIEPNTEIFENNKPTNALKVVIIIFLTFTAFIAGIILGRALCSKYHRKIRANELEDNYSYLSNNNKVLYDNKIIEK